MFLIGLLFPTKETKYALTEFKNQGNYIVVATVRGQVPIVSKK